MRELELRAIEPGDLNQQPPWAAEEVAGFGAAVATTLADLHDLGIVHGSLGPEHVLVDGTGRPLLCGFGRARRWVVDEEPDPRLKDVADLARSLEARLPHGASRDLRNLLARAASDRRHRPMTARRLARALGEAVSAPRLPAAEGANTEARAVPVHGASAVGEVDVEGAGRDPDGAEPFGTGKVTSDPAGAGETDAPAARRSIRRGRACRRVRFGVIAALATAGLTAFLVTVFLTSASHRAITRVSDAPTQGVTRCPAVDRGCHPLSGADGVFTLPEGRYRMGGAGDVIVLGRWTCAPTALPALFRPSSGQVWVFASWARGRHDVKARLVATVPGGRSLRVVAGPRNCDRLDVLRRGASPLLVVPASS